MTASYPAPEKNTPPPVESVWSYRGYRLRSSEVTTAEESVPSQKGGQASRRRHTILALVVTDSPQTVRQKIFQEMKRSGTLLRGQGIYA